jgi:hypothetical protein
VKKLFELYKIQNGYLLRKEEYYKSFQDHEINDQRQQLLNDIIDILKFKNNYRVVSTNEAMRIYRAGHDGT